MTNAAGKLSGLSGLVLAVAVIGCVTALSITGHIPGNDALIAIVGVATGGTGIVAAHVGGAVATNAAGAVTGISAPSTPTPAAPAPVNSAGATTVTGTGVAVP